MAECRYFPECQRCNEVGDSWLPCAGGSDGTRCNGYEPMPDRDQLMELADGMERIADRNWLTGTMSIIRARSWADSIREALGVVDHDT